jgi:hypothetical protein
VRQTRGNPLIGTEDFTPAEVKEIASMAMRRYRKTALINYVKSPGKTLRTVFGQPKIVMKYVRDLASA